jgi:hypothetical protein
MRYEATPHANVVVPLLYLAVAIVCLIAMHRRARSSSTSVKGPRHRLRLSALDGIGIIPATLQDVAATVGPCDVLLFHLGTTPTLVMAALVVSGEDQHNRDASVICSCSAFPQRGRRAFPQLGELMVWLRGLSANRPRAGVNVTLLRHRNRMSHGDIFQKLSAAATVVPCDPTRSCFAYVGAILETVGLVPRSMHPWRDYSSELMTEALLRNTYYIHTRFGL